MNDRALNRQPLPSWAIPLSGFLFLVALPLDRHISALMPADSTQFGYIHDSFRALGYFPTWLAVSILIYISNIWLDRPRNRVAAISILTTSAVSGGSAEILKILIRRPDIVPGKEGDWGPVPWGSSWWDGTDFCFPSGHSAVAWGAAIALSRSWPRLTPLWLILAAGCAAGRIQARGHHASDVLASLFLALLISHLLYPSTNRNISD